MNKKWPYTIKYTASNSKSSQFFSVLQNILQNVSEKSISCFREAFCFWFVFHGQKHVPLFFTVVFMDHLPQNHLRCFKNATQFHLSQKLWVLRPECQQTCRLVCIKVWQPLLCAVWIMELQWLPYISGRKVWVKL